MFKQTDLIQLFGKRGSGKTTLGKFLQRSFPRVLILDPLHEYSREEVDAIATTPRQLAEFLIRFRAAGINRFRIAFRFQFGDEDQDLETFDTILNLVFRYGNLMVVIEEIQHFMRGEYITPALKRLVFQGRHRKVGIMGTSQKPSMVSKKFVSQCHHVFVARMFERNDLRYFADTLSVEEEDLKSLPQFVFFHWRDDGKLSRIRAPFR